MDPFLINLTQILLLVKSDEHSRKKTKEENHQNKAKTTTSLPP